MSIFHQRRSRLDGISGRLWTKESNPANTFRLDLPDSGGLRPLGRRQKLFHYIAAGGLRQTRAQRQKHPELAARALVIRIFIALAAFWLIFRFV